MKTIAAYIAVLFIAAGMAGAASAQDHKGHHKDFAGNCVTCHGEKSPKAVSKLLCANCHGTPEDMARKTEARKTQNPHTSIHFGTSLPCEECHKQHKPSSYNYCTEACHRTWPNKIP